MFDTIVFDYPWTLFALVAFAILTFIPHFKIAKKYRRNRTRITSLVLHCIVAVLAVLTMAGMHIDYTVANDENEIILLVDMSDSEESVEDDRDSCVETALNYGSFDGFNVGVVTFGYDQVYAAPLTNDVKSVYSQYLLAEKPDTSATDIASALNYTASLFNYPKTSKIVLITDCKETDEEAKNVIKAISAAGTKVDVVEFNTDYKETDAQITSLKLPDSHISIGEEQQISFDVMSNEPTTITASLYDNNVLVKSDEFSAVGGSNSFALSYTFGETGFHELKVVIDSKDDHLENNNAYYTFIDIQDFNNVLILERAAGESDLLVSILTQDDLFKCTVINVFDDDLPASVDDLRAYDQIILNNISNSDLPDGYIEMINDFVYTYGGGLFTVGGENENGEANTYNRQDMYGTLYQDMLPVTAINYTPPVGVVIIIDKSGSMTAKDNDTGKSYLELAELGALSCLDVLSERDYVGIMTLESTYGIVLEMTPRTQEGKIRAAIDSIGTSPGGGTVFYTAIERAGQQLSALQNVARRHIIIVSDGMPADQTGESGNPVYMELIDKLYKQSGITTSIVIMGKDSDSTAAQNMKQATDFGHGYLYAISDVTQVSSSMREDLSAPEIKDVNDMEFYPTIKNIFSPIVYNVNYSTDMETTNQILTKITGFYGVKAKTNADLLLVGDYEVPLYAQWKYGEGMVGSIMIDLQGNYSGELLNSDDGKQLVKNIVRNLMPNESIRPSEIKVKLTSDNYTNNLSVITSLNEGEYITGEIVNLSDSNETIVNLSEMPSETPLELREEACYVKTCFTKDNDYTRVSFVIRTAGIYQINIMKKNANDETIASTTLYREYSYSDEYDIYLEAIDAEELASKGNGTVIADNEDPIEIFDGFVTKLDKTFDPRILFMIMIIVCFLADIAVRKFKFKWPHEIIQSYKQKKDKEAFRK